MKKIRYVTFFPECEHVHLKKDVGMLPYSLGKYKGYDFKIVCYQHESITLEDREKFNIEFVEREKDDIRDFVKYIKQNGRQIDILNIYHITSRRNIRWIWAYKTTNPNGKVHVKLDADYRMIDMFNPKSRRIKDIIKNNLLIKKVDLFSVESTHMKSILEKKWLIPMEVVPNGIFREDRILPVKWEEKENVFLTVGRLGTEQKATEDLLEAFALTADKTDWKLWLVGSIEDEFNSYIQKYFENNPRLKDRITLFGNINDAEKLTELYRYAKVFVLPSKWESFAIVLLEALECGDYLIVSDQVPSAEDIGRNGKYASIVPYHDINKLSDTMIKLANRNDNDDELLERTQWIYSNFTWERIAENLDQLIQRMV